MPNDAVPSRADPAAIAAVVRAATIAHVGFVDGGEPYLVPLNFGWRPGQGLAPDRFWFHSSPSGRKARLIATRPRVCVQVEADGRLITHDHDACAWTQAYRSLMAWGTARAAGDRREQQEGLDVLMRNHAGRGGWTYPDRLLARTLVWCVEVELLSVKVHRLDGPAVPPAGGEGER